jgi:phosphoribosylanthranilate isomerase
MTSQRDLPIRCPQVKICGLTWPDEAALCAEAGADAIGLVFYEKSPRNVSIDQGKAVADALPWGVVTVGVFVNENFDFIMSRVKGCGLAMVQLHGKESPELVGKLKGEGVGVIKGLFVDGAPGLENAGKYPADAFLVECSKGPLPGGNAMTWDWAAAKDFGFNWPLVLAGGLSPENVTDAIFTALPAAVDLSSSVETEPGRKDSDRVTRLIAAVRETESYYKKKGFKPVFRNYSGKMP